MNARYRTANSRHIRPYERNRAAETLAWTEASSCHFDHVLVVFGSDHHAAGDLREVRELVRVGVNTRLTEAVRHQCRTPVTQATHSSCKPVTGCRAIVIG